MIFNERLRKLREEQGLTQKQAAEELGMPMRSYQRLEAEGSKTHYDTLLLLGDYFHVSVDYLMGRTEKRAINR